MRSGERRDDLGARLGGAYFGRAIVADIRIGKLVDDPVRGSAANRPTGKCDKGKVALIGGRKTVCKDDVAHTKSRQRLEQDIGVGWIPAPRNEGVKAGISKQSSTQIMRLRRDELTIFIGGG